MSSFKRDLRQSWETFVSIPFNILAADYVTERLDTQGVVDMVVWCAVWILSCMIIVSIIKTITRLINKNK